MRFRNSFRERNKRGEDGLGSTVSTASTASRLCLLIQKPIMRPQETRYCQAHTKWCEHQMVLRSEIHHATKTSFKSADLRWLDLRQLPLWYKYEESAYSNPAIQDEFRRTETYIASLVAGRGLIQREYIYILPDQTFHSALYDPWRTVLHQYKLFRLCSEHKTRG